MTGVTDPNSIEAAALKHCEFLLGKSQGVVRDALKATVVLAFTVGAAWALDRPDMIELAKAQMESIRARRKV